MTTRHSGYIVVLSDDVREDDAEAVITALRMVRGVVTVAPVEAGRAGDVIAEARRDTKWTDALLELVDRVRRS